MDDIKKLLALEAKYQLDTEIMERFLSTGDEIRLSNREVLINEGEYNPDIYIVKEGLIKGGFMDKNNEKIVGFALPGTLLISFHSYYSNKPSYYRFEALGPTTVIHISRAHFDTLIKESHEFTLWVMSAHQNQLFYNESRHHMLTGDARNRMQQLFQRLSSFNIDNPSQIQPLSAPTDEASVLKEVNQRWKKLYKILPAKVLASYLGITDVYLCMLKREFIREIIKKQ